VAFNPFSSPAKAISKNGTIFIKTIKKPRIILDPGILDAERN
jgi:hypothetical protein